MNHSPDAFDFEYVEYYQMVRYQIEEYRLLFIDWVAGFDKWDYIIDCWGLFNPPGVSPFDKDPDNDVPFRGFEDGSGERTPSFLVANPLGYKGTKIHQELIPMLHNLLFPFVIKLLSLKNRIIINKRMN